MAAYASRSVDPGRAAFAFRMILRCDRHDRAIATRIVNPMESLSEMRQIYQKGELNEDGVLRDPIAQFAAWFSQIRETDILEPNAMILSTVGPDGTPSARTVLLKSFDESGFVFYTSYESQKGVEIAANPAVAITFYWPTLERQVRINGLASRISPEQSDAYFATRPHGSQLGAIVSPQSAVIPDRWWLVERLREVEAESGGGALQRPATWGGYRIEPQTIEFWQGRPDRLHDRIRYRHVDGDWTIERLAP